MGLKIGLTGQIGTGKSTIGFLLKGKGAQIIEADTIVGKLLNTKDIREAIQHRVSSTVFDLEGNIDKKKLGNIVFNDAKSLVILEEILHPPTIQIMQEKLRKGEFCGKDTIVVGIVPLLLETGLKSLFDQIVLVQSNLNNQLTRSQKNLGLSPEDTLKRISRQMPQDEQKKYADYVIQNNDGLKELEEQTVQLWNQLKQTLKQGE
ncbi:MAG: dephospho-CoA kinase [Chlamydiota bacterium]|nr:dephospho-CoA kinase [Chlamydiota bacterium]